MFPLDAGPKQFLVLRGLDLGSQKRYQTGDRSPENSVTHFALLKAQQHNGCEIENWNHRNNDQKFDDVTAILALRIKLPMGVLWNLLFEETERKHLDQKLLARDLH